MNNEQPIVPKEVEEVIQENTTTTNVYVPEEETKSNNSIIYIIILAVIILAIIIAIVVIISKKNPDLGLSGASNSVEELKINRYELSGYALNLPEKYQVSEQEGNRLIITNYNDKVQLSLEIIPDLDIDYVNENKSEIATSFKEGYHLTELSDKATNIMNRNWQILSSEDNDGFNYTFSFTELKNAVVSILTISQLSDYSNLYKELSSIIDGITFDSSYVKEEETEEPEPEPEEDETGKTDKTSTSDQKAKPTNPSEPKLPEQQKPDTSENVDQSITTPSTPDEPSPTTDDKPTVDPTPSVDETEEPTKTPENPTTVEPEKSPETTEPQDDKPSTENGRPKKSPRQKIDVPLMTPQNL